MEANPLEWLMQCGQEGLVSCPREYSGSEASVMLLVFVNDYGVVIQLEQGSFCLSHVDELAC